MIIYLAGSDTTESVLNLLVKKRVPARLQSFYYCYNHDPQIDHFEHYMIDSGGYTARGKGEDVSVEAYADYINEHGIELALELDTRSREETLYNRRYLIENTSAYIVPIYHYQSFRDGRLRSRLNYLTKHYPYIGVGGVAGVPEAKMRMQELYDFIFNTTRDNTRVHGLGITTKKILERYPFYSVDSTSWHSFGRYGRSTRYVEEGKKKRMKVLSKTKHYLKLHAREIDYWLDQQRFLTRLWKRRGVHWQHSTPDPLPSPPPDPHV